MSHTRYRALQGPGANPCVQAVSPQVNRSHPPGGRLPLYFVRPAVTFSAEERHRPSAGTKLYCLVTEAHACEQLAHEGCYLEADRPRFEPATFRIASELSTVKPHRRLCVVCILVLFGQLSLLVSCLNLSFMRHRVCSFYKQIND